MKGNDKIKIKSRTLWKWIIIISLSLLAIIYIPYVFFFTLFLVLIFTNRKKICEGWAKLLGCSSWQDYISKLKKELKTLFWIIFILFVIGSIVSAYYGNLLYDYSITCESVLSQEINAYNDALISDRQTMAEILKMRILQCEEKVSKISWLFPFLEIPDPRPYLSELRIQISR